ncbi:MAG: hypothetical protein K5905_12015 [Roseibium sp.]|uniref:hypothetical protein n=1 Tax=Roseibium sp. TaxID=1936156 RepID=UPI0026273DF9|nr:hypothetical protein [Roseibium sp.]MCV0426192.1 hypothetical protein [Roseibium sp.]
MKLFALAAGALACLTMALFASAPAVAAPAIDTLIDLSPVLDLVMPLVVPVVVGIGGFVLTKVMRLIGLELDAKHRMAVDQALERAIGYGASKVGERFDINPQIDVKNELVAIAAQYAMEHIPGALKHFGITQDKLVVMIEARLNVDLNGDGLVGDPETSPA